MQKEANTKLRDLLKNNKAKTRNLSELSKTEQNKLVKLNTILDEPRRGENVGNRRLSTWATEGEKLKQIIERNWESRQKIRVELKDKEDKLKRYEDKLKWKNFLQQIKGLQHKRKTQHS